LFGCINKKKEYGAVGRPSDGKTVTMKLT